MKIKRPIYMQRLIDSKDNGLIKIVTGLRRVGNTAGYQKFSPSKATTKRRPISEIFIARFIWVTSTNGTRLKTRLNSKNWCAYWHQVWAVLSTPPIWLTPLKAWNGWTTSPTKPSRPTSVISKTPIWLKRPTVMTSKDGNISAPRLNTILRI